MDADTPAPPSNTEAEQALLGAILVNPVAYSRVSDFLTPEHFFDPVHGRIFCAIGTLIERGDPADPVTLRNLFDQDGALQDIGGGAYLARLAASAVSVLNSENYGRTILDMHQRRALIAVGTDIVARGYTTDLDDPAERQIEAAETALAGLSQGRPGGGDVMASAGDAAMRSIRGSEAAHRGDATGGIMSGIGALDGLTGGWQPGDLIYIGKRPSMGGTALGITLALNAARAGKRVGFWSAEMNAERIGRRILAWMTGISTRAQRAGELSQSEWSALIAAQRELASYPMLIDDASPLGVATLRRRARQMGRKGLDLIVADYLQLIRSGDGRDDMPLRDAVPKVSAALRDIAKELHVPVICLAQLTPDIDGRENKRPTISDIRWCLPGSARVYNPQTGQRMRIDNIAGEHPVVLGLDGDWKFSQTVASCWAAGVQPILKIVTRSGRVLRCSPRHQLLTDFGYRAASGLDVGAFVATPREYPCAAAQSISLSQSVLLGWMIGDGYLRGSPMLALSARDMTIAQELSSDAFPGLVFRVRDNGNGRGECLSLTLSSGMRGAKSNALTCWLRKIGAWGHTGSDKHVPDIVFTQPAAVVGAFLRGLFHADGSFIRAHQTVQFTSISERLCRDVQHLLLRLAICSSVKTYDKPASGFSVSPYRMWVVEIYNREHVTRFFDVVGFLGEKHAAALVSLTRKSTDSGALDRLPPGATDSALKLRSQSGLTWKTLGWRNQGKLMSRETAARVGLAHSDRSLFMWGSSDIYWDTVASVVPDGEEETYDLSAPFLENFCVDDFVTHNSHDAEQDAAVVAMLYRDEYYLQRAEPRASANADQMKADKLHAEWGLALEHSRGRAEIIIVKNRDDPTGTAHIAFDGVRSLFTDIEENQGRFL